MHELKVNVYKWEKVPEESKLIKISEEDQYYFEEVNNTSIRIQSVYYDDRSLRGFEATFVYLKGIVKIEKILILASKIRVQEHIEKNPFLSSWLLTDHFKIITKDQFTTDLNLIIEKLR